MGLYAGQDPRLEGLRLECSDQFPDVWSRYTVRERNGMVIADNLTWQQVEMLFNPCLSGFLPQ